METTGAAMAVLTIGAATTGAAIGPYGTAAAMPAQRTTARMKAFIFVVWLVWSVDSQLIELEN